MILPRGPYGVIYADPPWSFAAYSEKGKDRSAERHYECMTIEKIERLPVAESAGANCVLLMWTTDPMLEKALGVIRAWGFVYKTVGFTWVKTNKLNGRFFVGMGFWTRANAEHCLLATRGHPKRTSADVQRLIVSPRREHSRKPDEAYDRIERLCAGPYLELWARQKRAGWDACGNETEKFARMTRMDNPFGLFGIRDTLLEEQK